MRWVVMGITATMMTTVGCSGQCVLVVQNLSSGVVSVKVFSNEQRHDFLESELTRGDEVETIRWHGQPPDWIEVTVKHENARTETRKWLRTDYPPMMQDGSSLTEYFVLEVHAKEMRLRDPTAWDAVRRNPVGYGLLVLWPVGVVLGVVLAIRRRKREAMDGMA